MAVSPDDTTFVDRYTAPFGGPLNLGLALLANSGYSTQPRTFGQTIGISALQAQQMQLERQKQLQEQQDAALMRRYREAQIAHLNQPTNENAPNSVKEYEYAKANGFKGSFQDWITAGGQSSRPSSVQEWDFYAKLSADQQARYLEMKRNPNVFFGKVNEVPTIARAPSAGMPAQVTPLSDQASEQAAAQGMKAAEQRGSQIGEAQGKIQGGIETKGANALGTRALLDIADPLIDVATGSATGAARDKVNAFFGEATTGAQAIAKLQVIQAGLMTGMPRMEGPQSDRDVQLYREAAGQIGDPKVPAAQKKAALETIRQIQDKYIERAGGSPQQQKKTIGGKTYVKQNGQWYEDAP